MASREKLKAEAILRMKKIGISGEAAALFEKENIIGKSLPKSTDFSALDKEQTELAKTLEEKHGILIYFVITAYTSIGEIDSYLYVDGNEEQWEKERAELAENKTSAYICVCKIPDYSAFGTAGFEIIPGAEIRYTGRKDLMS